MRGCVALDTRGGGRRVLSLGAADGRRQAGAGRLNGRLAGVHVNMAERLSLFRKGVIVAVSRRSGCRSCCTCMRPSCITSTASCRRRSRCLRAGFFRWPTSCIVLGEASRDFVMETLKVPPEKIEIVINGVPAPSLPRRIRHRDDPQRILFLGNLSERKGVSDLLRRSHFPASTTMSS